MYLLVKVENYREKEYNQQAQPTLAFLNGVKKIDSIKTTLGKKKESSKSTKLSHLNE